MPEPARALTHKLLHSLEAAAAMKLGDSILTRRNVLCEEGQREEGRELAALHEPSCKA